MSILVADISKYQMVDNSKGVIDFAKMRSNDIRAVIFRLCACPTVGDLYEDRRVHDYISWLDAFNHGAPSSDQLHLAAYYMPIRLERDLTQQAQYLFDSFARVPRRKVFIDLEGARPYGLDPYEARNRLREFLKLTSGIATGIYTRQSWFDEYIAPADWGVELWAARWPGMIAWNLPRLSGPWTDGQYQFESFRNWTLYQYGTPAVGNYLGVESKEIDMNLFNGDYPALLRWLGLVDEPATIEERVKYLASLHGLNW